jgi:hypothetical protein
VENPPKLETTLLLTDEQPSEYTWAWETTDEQPSQYTWWVVFEFDSFFAFTMYYYLIT